VPDDILQGMKVYFAADHAGFELKSTLMAFIRQLGYEVEDCGAYEFVMEDDYPAFVSLAARSVSESVENTARGIVIGASGEGEAIVANRFRGVRAVVFYGGGREQKDASGQTLDIIKSSRIHNNSNVLSLGARFLTEDEAKKAVEGWLTTPFSGEERHMRRIAQIDAYAV